MHRTNLKLLAAVCACGVLGVAHADDRNPLDSKIIVDLGMFFLSTDMRVRVDGETTNDTGDDVDFDDTFGIGDFDRFRGEASWRFAPRHTLRAMYFENNRDATRTLNRDVVFQDETYQLGATVTATSNVKVAQLAYDYAFMRRETYEITAGIGFHYVEIGLGLDTTLTSQGGATASGSRSSDASTSAPLPVLALRGTWQLPANFYLTAQAQYFYVDFDDYTGRLNDLKVTLVWQCTDHVGIGLGYNDFGFRFDIEDKRNFDGRLRWSYGGAIAFASVMF